MTEPSHRFCDPPSLDTQLLEEYLVTHFCVFEHFIPAKYFNIKIIPHCPLSDFLPYDGEREITND